MDYVNLGRSGLKVSRICLGTMTYGSPKWRAWVLPEEDSRPFIKRAIDLGVDFFDTADVYSMGVSEQILGKALRDFARREEVVIATKVCNPMGKGVNEGGLSRLHILRAVEDSLRRLGTDHIDLYQIHRLDADTPMEEMLEALHDLVKAGKVRYIGASNMRAWEFAKSLYLADLHGWTRFISMQNHYNLVYREEEREMLPLCRAEGVGVIPWSPLARGFLAGNREDRGGGQTTRAKTDSFAHEWYYKEDDFAVVESVRQVAARRGVSPAQFSLAWLLQRPGVTSAIVGASKLEHLEEAVAAMKIRISEEEASIVEGAYRPHPTLGVW
jgi:aryl-alcohol dehydrogenase-like predicted oxidoreductase